MRHSRILVAAIAAGLGGSALLVAPSSIEQQLYDYARERKFPPPETLARKAAEIAGGDFPYASLAEAPESARAFFTAFRAVIEALEPFHEDDTEEEDISWATQGTEPPPRNLLDEAVADAGAADPKDLVDMAIVGKSLMESITAHGGVWPLNWWAPAESPAEIVGDLVVMLQETPIAEIEAQRKKLEPEDPQHVQPKPAAQNPGAPAVDGAAAVSLDPGAAGGANAAPVPDAGSEAPAEAGKSKKKIA